MHLLSRGRFFRLVRVPFGRDMGADPSSRKWDGQSSNSQVVSGENLSQAQVLSFLAAESGWSSHSPGSPS